MLFIGKDPIRHEGFSQHSESLNDKQPIDNEKNESFLKSSYKPSQPRKELSSQVPSMRIVKKNERKESKSTLSSDASIVQPSVKNIAKMFSRQTLETNSSTSRNAITGNF